jgi:hypothetical protein
MGRGEACRRGGRGWGTGGLRTPTGPDDRRWRRSPGSRPGCGQGPARGAMPPAGRCAGAMAPWGPAQGTRWRLACVVIITETWRGRPLVRHAVRVHRRAHTTTAAGLRVEAALDPAPDATGQQGSDNDLAPVTIDPADGHGPEWTSVIKPRGTKR